MNRTLTILAIGASLFAGIAAPAQAADVSLLRLDCGTPQAPTRRQSSASRIRMPMAT